MTTLDRIATAVPLLLRAEAETTAALIRAWAAANRDLLALTAQFVRGNLEALELAAKAPDYDDLDECWPGATTTEVKDSAEVQVLRGEDGEEWLQLRGGVLMPAHLIDRLPAETIEQIVHDEAPDPEPVEPPQSSVVLVYGEAWQRIIDRWYPVAEHKGIKWAELVEIGKPTVIYTPKEQ